MFTNSNIIILKEDQYYINNNLMFRWYDPIEKIMNYNLYVDLEKNPKYMLFGIAHILNISTKLKKKDFIKELYSNIIFQ